jgi:two-component system CheB/CheR fusion protein
MAEQENKDTVKILSPNHFPVVGVGASAGGLEAFKRLLKAIPEDSGMAYILVQHLEPTHESILTALLQKVTRIPIHEITNNVHVEPDQIYIIPSNKLLTATDGVLQLSPRPPRNEKNMPIDVFFASLAEVHQSHAIGVVLSGTATDGTLGLKAIKEHGGITFAQDQRSAGFDGMPQSAIDAEVVDFILTPEEIPLRLATLNQTFKAGFANDSGDLLAKKEEGYRQLLSLLRVRKGTDFTYYKQTTIRRRILRRMGLNKIENIEDYLGYVRENPAEQDILYQDLLIPVTEFFRDPKIFDTLCDTIFPLLLKDKDNGKPLRVWVAGCSTGEEPYSMAICIHEYLGERAADVKIQFFATDVSEKSIAKARNGIYTKRDVATLSAGRLQKYFTKVNGSFHISKFIRDMCVFACHNFLKDPPFAKMDLISCRNVLIYMEPFLQKKALTIFHYALNGNGYLLLGKSETVGPAADLFAAFGKYDKFYSRRSVPGRFLHVVGGRNEKSEKDNSDPGSMEPGHDDFQKSADALLLSKYTPPGVVVDGQMDIVQFRGSTGAWLEQSPGKPTLNVFKMAREGLAFELRNALHKVKTVNKSLVRADIPFLPFNGKQEFVTIEVIPLANTAEPHFLILFKEPGRSVVVENGAQANIQPGSPKLRQTTEMVHVHSLEAELRQLREDMKSVTEDQEAINEELQSANEELLSGSEELQSLNEELETSKEEIQSTNEELITLNHELFDRNDQLNLSRIYSESIVATIREPLIILDRDFRVKTANRSFYDKFRTTEEATEGKLLYDIGNGQWNIHALRSMLGNVLLNQNKVTGFEIKQTFDIIGERVMLLNARQIFRQDNTEQLILLAIEDITEAKKLETELKLFTNELERQVEERTASLRDAITALQHSNENLEQFATIASHDLQEPLRKIRTFVSLLNVRHGKDISGEAKEFMQKISVSAERMSALIRDVLHFSKIIDSGGAYERADLNEILNNVIGDFDLLAIEKKAEISHDQLPVIDAIPLQMNQLFFNLLSNALKFTTTGVDAIISISSGTLSEEDKKKYPDLKVERAYCEIIFKDNGIGFDEQYAEQMFLIFHRLNSREIFEGTGIGLALCKKIVMNHRGEIYAEAKRGEGTKFHVILPFEREIIF